MCHPVDVVKPRYRFNPEMVLMNAGPDVTFPSSAPVFISNFSMAEKVFVLEGRLPDALPGGEGDFLTATFTDDFGMTIFSFTVDVALSEISLSCAYNVSEIS